jgi:regulator of protease activity HflC (stomatin/prohibitin superfamily)
MMWKKMGAIALCVGALSACGMHDVAGNEAAILETCDGVEDKVYSPGTYFFSPVCREMYKYNVGTQLQVLRSCEGKQGDDQKRCIEERDEDCFKVKVKGGQEVCLDQRTEYQINSETLVALHRSVKNQYESIVLRPAVIRATKNRATLMTADELYADTTQVALEKKVEEELLADDDVKRAGIKIHSFIIEAVHLDPAYEAEVKQKSVAQQKRLKEIELAAAAQESAKRAAAEALTVVEQTSATAEGEKIKTVKAAEAERDAAKLRAEGLLAQGKAEAEIDRLKRDALYAGEGGAWRAKVEIAKAQAETMKVVLAGVQIIPENAVLQLVGSGAQIAPVTPVVNAHKQR